MRTYKEFITVMEQVTGGSLMFTRRLGSSGLPGSTAVTGNVSGGSAKGTQFSGSATGGYGTVSGQGDKINRGISASIDNSTSGGGDKEWKGVPYRTPNADTSTSTIRKGAFGSLNANVSGGAARTASKPESPKPEKPKVEPPKPTRPTATTPKPPVKPPTAADERLMGQNTPAGAAARERQSAINRQNAEINRANPQSPTSSQPFPGRTQQPTVKLSDVKSDLENKGYMSSGSITQNAERTAADRAQVGSNPTIRSQGARDLQNLNAIRQIGLYSRPNTSGLSGNITNPDGSISSVPAGTRDPRVRWPDGSYGYGNVKGPNGVYTTK